MSAGSVCLPSVSTHARVRNAHIIIVSKMDDFLEIFQSALDSPPPEHQKSAICILQPSLLHSKYFNKLPHSHDLDSISI